MSRFGLHGACSLGGGCFWGEFGVAPKRPKSAALNRRRQDSRCCRPPEGPECDPSRRAIAKSQGVSARPLVPSRRHASERRSRTPSLSAKLVDPCGVRFLFSRPDVKLPADLRSKYGAFSLGSPESVREERLHRRVMEQDAAENGQVP